jgi:hypothetical protein
MSIEDSTAGRLFGHELSRICTNPGGHYLCTFGLSFLRRQESTLTAKMDTGEGAYDTLSGSNKTADIVGRAPERKFV